MKKKSQTEYTIIYDFILDNNPCSPSPCLNGAGCQVSGSSYICSCLSGYSGTNCQICNLKLIL